MSKNVKSKNKQWYHKDFDGWNEYKKQLEVKKHLSEIRKQESIVLRLERFGIVQWV